MDTNGATFAERAKSSPSSGTTSGSARILPLLSEIMGDARYLARKELELANEEFRVELTKLLNAVVLLGFSLGMGIGSIALIGFGLVYLLQAQTWFTPGGGPLPLWLCFMIVAAVEVLIATPVFLAAKKKLKGMHLLPKRFLSNLEEDLQWATQLKS